MTDLTASETSGPPKPVRIGSVISESFSLVARHPGVFGGLALLFTLPFMAFYYLETTGVGEGGDEDVTTAIALVAFFGLYFVFQFVLSAAVASGTFLSLQGKPVTFQDCLRVGFGRFWPVVGVSFLSVLVIGVGLVLLVIPGIIALAWLYVAVPVVVIERKSIVKSLGRSRELTKGSRIAILALLVLLTFFDWTSGALIELLAPATGGSFSVNLNVFLTLISSTISFLFAALFPAVLYFKLRMAKEGIGVEQIAAVFD